MKRTLSAVLLAVALSLTGACTESQSGDSFDDNQTDQAPGLEQDAEDEGNVEDDD